MPYSSEAEPFIVFPVAEFLLGLPIAAVVKVVSYPLANTKAKASGFVPINNQPIPLLNLHQQLPTSRINSDANGIVSKTEVEWRQDTGINAAAAPAHSSLDFTQSASLIHPQGAVGSFLVIVYCQEELYAIPVDEPPNLVQILKNNIRHVPKVFNRQGFFALVDEVAVLYEPETTVFLLNLEQVGMMY